MNEITLEELSEYEMFNEIVKHITENHKEEALAYISVECGLALLLPKDNIAKNQHIVNKYLFFERMREEVCHQ
jgi:hypothetical protein